jgi:low affinity Fe/Cu permease
LAVQLKLNEIVAALEGASNRLIGVEELSESELLALHDRYEKLAEMTRSRSSRRSAESVENAGGAQPPPDNRSAEKRAGALGL